MCKSTTREEYITCYPGNTTAEERDEQHSCLGKGVVFAALQHHSMWKMRGLAYMCCRVGCAWHIYVNGRCIVVSFQKNSLNGHETRLVKGAWHVNGWYIGFGWKVHGMVHGKMCMAFFYTPCSRHQEGFSLKVRPSWDQAEGLEPWSILEPKHG